MDGQPMQRARRWMPLTLLLALFIAAQIAVGIAGAIAPKPRGHWTGHLTNATIDAAMLTIVVAGAALAWRRLGQRLALLLAVVALAVVTVGLLVEVIGNLRVAQSIWRTPYGDEQVNRIGSQFNGYDSGHDLQSKGDLVVLVGGVAFAIILGATKRVGEYVMIAGILLICAGTPGQQRVRVDGDLLLAAGRMDGVEPGSTVERPQRSEDERPGRRRGPSQDQHSEGRIPGQRIGTTSEQATGGAAMAGVRGRPALSWSAGRWPGDVMIDGVSHRVRPLVLSGPASVAWRQEHCGSWPRRISGVGRARTSRIGQATRPRSGVSDGGA
jgi:hypothetical protein